MAATAYRPQRDEGWGDVVRDGFVGTVGKTPLIRLNSLSEATGCEILAKAEWMQPGGSVKDRAAKFCIEAAERSGALKPGGTVVEGTAGNTGIGLAHICAAKGYKCVIFMPNTQSKEKMDTLRMLGAEVHAVPPKPYADDGNYQKMAGRHAETLEGAVWTSQFENTANREAHIATTGPEVWEQTKGKVDAFVCATGTGGTLAGMARYFKKEHPGKVKVFLADPPGSCMYNWFVEGKLERKGDGSATEGIGNGRVTGNMEGTKELLDGAVYISDERSTEMVFHLLEKEGIFVGLSSAVNAVAATDIAKQLGPGHTIVTLLCDSGDRYKSRLMSRAWLQEKNLLDSVPEHLRHRLAD